MGVILNLSENVCCQYLINFHISSSERDYEGSEGDPQEEDEDRELDEAIEEENEDIARAEEEQEREDQEMMEGHQRNHIGILVLGVDSDVTSAVIILANF